MFCRSCWANLPDGTEQCPRCHHDPRVAPVPLASDSPSSPALSAAAPAQSASVNSGPRPGRNLGRLNAALAGIFVLIVAGPPLVRWWETSRALAPPVGTAPVTSEPQGAMPEAVLPRVAEPAAAPTSGDDPAARAVREAYTLYQRGLIVEACERYREVAAHAGRDDVRRSL